MWGELRTSRSASSSLKVTNAYSSFAAYKLTGFKYFQIDYGSEQSKVVIELLFPVRGGAVGVQVSNVRLLDLKL